MAELEGDILETVPAAPPPELPAGDAPALPDASPAELAAKRIQRSTLRPGSDSVHPLKGEAPIPQIQDDAAYDALRPGSKFTGPDGKPRFKPIKTNADYEALPEGSEFVDPDGKKRTKPKYEQIDFTAQTLYDMSLTDAEKKKALERSYPGKVKQDREGLYVDDNGTLRRPGRGDSARLAAAHIPGAIVPTAGAIAGGLFGGALGTPGGPGGIAAGGMAGAAVGSGLGQQFNDLVLGIAGIYDRTPGEHVANTALAAASGAVGEGLGRGVAALVPSLKAGGSALSTAAPGAAAKFLGADPAATTAARELAEKGVLVPPSAWAKEAPHLQNVVEVFDPAFRTQAPLLESATKHYEQSATKILEDLGVKVPGPIVKPTADVPTQRTGEAILNKTLAESKAADDRMRTLLEERKAALLAGTPEKVAQQEALARTANEARTEAQKLIDLGFKDIRGEVDTAMKVAQAGQNSGDLWWNVGEKLRAVRQGIATRANEMYGQADELAGGTLPNSRSLSPTAREFANQLPDGFKQKYPDIVKKLEDLAGVRNPETGEWIKEPVTPTFGQLHNLRSLMRGNVDYYSLSHDVREGTYKFFAKRVDDILHDVKAAPELQAAAKQLDLADKFYAENMGPLRNANIEAVVKGLEGGLPADPKNLFNTLIKDGRSDLTTKVRELVGPNLWAGVKAADVQEMLDMSKTLIPGKIDGKRFAREVLDRERHNMLSAVHGPEASEKLLKQAQSIAMLDGNLPIPSAPGDTLTTLIGRARLAEEAAKAAAKKDPLGTLKSEMRAIQRDHALEQKQMRDTRNADPLGFLYKPTTGATEAVEKILGNEDMLLAAAARFGEKSPEFDMLRQIYAQRILRGTLEPGKQLEKVSPEVQQLMFPGVTLSQMQVLAKEMDFLVGASGLNKGTAQGMSAMSKVEHPWSNIVGRGGPISRVLTAPAKVIPGADSAGRSLLTKYYATLTKIMTSPATLRWVEKGLTGSPEQRDLVRGLLQKHMQRGAATGAGVGESLYQQGNE